MFYQSFLVSQRVIDLDSISFHPHSYFSYHSYELLEAEMQIRKSDSFMPIKSSKELLSLDHVLKNDIQKGGSYWVSVIINSTMDTVILMEAGQTRIATWGEVDVYLEKESDSLHYYTSTGVHEPISNKQIQNAYNLLLIPLSKGENHIHLHLSDFYTLKNEPQWQTRYKSILPAVNLFIHDQDTYNALTGYQFNGTFNGPKRGFVFNHNYFKQSLKVFCDQTGNLNLDQVRSLPLDAWTDHYAAYPTSDKVYWVKLNLIGSEFHPEEYLMGMNTGGFWNFGEMDIYNVLQNGIVSHQRTGIDVSKSEKTFESNWNLFKARASANDTTQLFIRCASANERFLPEFTISHIDTSTFWPRIFDIQLIYGAFLGILIVQTFYFLILGFIEKETLHFWFTCLIIGFGLSLIFVGGDLNFFVFAKWEQFHPWLTALGALMMVFGLFGYMNIFLSLNELFPKAFDKVLTPLLIIHTCICGYFAFSLESIGGNIAVYEIYFQLLFGSLIFNFLVGLVYGVLAWLKNSEDAKYFVGAFAALIVILVIRLFFAFGSFQSTSGFQQDTILIGLYIHYIIFLGIILTIVLLGFSNGYRINRLKLDRQSALVRIEESAKSNRLLQEKNQVIQQRVKEKDFLLKEVHHRVKNNLQILSSLLNLQSDSVEDESIIHALQKSKNRVEAIGLIHQHLYTQDEMDAIDLHSYIDDLCIYLKDSMYSSDFNLKIISNVSVDKVDVKTAMPLGLIINELVTNSIKHAFIGRDSGRIEITIVIDENGNMLLTVRDNGTGILTAENTPRPSGQFGSKLIDILVKKLKGEINQHFQDGYNTTIVFKRFSVVE